MKREFVDLARPSDSFEIVPGRALARERLADCVFLLFSKWVHLVEVDPSSARNLRWMRQFDRLQEWAESRDPGSASGVAIDAWKRYRAVDGPLQSALLSLYVLVAVIPALLVLEEYLDAHPNALAERLTHHYRLSTET